MIQYPFPSRFERARYPTSYLRSGILEDQVQQAVIAALTTRWRAKVTVIDSGDRRLRGRAARLLTARGVNPNMLMKGMGGTMERGVVDLAVTFPGGLAGWFETKRPAYCVVSPRTGKLIIERPAGEPTDEQLAFLLEQHRLGAVAGLLWSPHDLEALIPCAEAA